MDCPVCGCRVEREDPEQPLIECGCCGTLWVVAGRDMLDRVLVGPEG